MKSKAPLTLMELLIMVLIFALTVGLCVRIFVTADQWSRESQLRDRAVAEVQNTAEMIKHHNGDLREIEEALDVQSRDKQLILYYDKDWTKAPETEAVYHVTVEWIPSPEPLMGSALVSSGVVGGEDLFGVAVGWQEVSEDE